MAFKLVEVRQEIMDENMAISVLKANKYKPQRGLKGNILENLRQKYDAGKLTVARIVYGLEGWNNNNELLLNGSHFSTIILEKKGEVEVTVEVYLCDTKEDMGILFNQIDPAISAKTDLDYARVCIERLETAWPPRWALRMINAHYWLNHRNQKPLTSDLKQEMITKEQIPVFNFISDLMRSDKEEKTKHMDSLAIFGAMMTSWGVNSDDAFTFWTGVCKGTDLAEGSPVFELREWLRLNTTPIARARAQAKRVTESGEVWSLTKHLITQHNICADAWNAYRKGKERVFLRKKRALIDDNELEKFK